MKPLRGKKCKQKTSLVREVLTPNVGGTPKGSTLTSFKIRENNLKEVGRGSPVRSASATTLAFDEVLRGNVMVAVNLST